MINLRLIPVVLFVLCSTTFHGSIAQTSVQSEIKNVTVFLSGAEINRSTEVNLKKGRNLIVLKELSPSLLKPA